MTTIVDAGSAGEANFHGFREYVIEPARERIKAFLNIGSIGLVACNRVSELIDMRSIDIDRTIACVEANRDVIIGIKVRASGVILGAWGITPVKIAKKVASILKLPLMVHVGEPPPLYDEVLEVLGPGDVVTHCFNGKAGGSIIEDEDLFALAERCAGRGHSPRCRPWRRLLLVQGRRSRDRSAGCCRSRSRPTCTTAPSTARCGTWAPPCRSCSPSACRSRR